MPATPDRQPVDLDGHRLVLSHLDKVIFPATGDTKAELLHYYATAAEVLLPHAAGRPASFVRAPDGPEGEVWFAKRPPPGTPDWVPVTEVTGKDGPSPHLVIDTPAALVALANLGALELHVPQWTTGTGPDGHDRLVLDLDPGPGTDLVTCCRVAQRLRQMLDDDGLTAFPLFSGSKGLHLYTPLIPTPEAAVSGYARTLALRLQQEHPGLVVASMARAARSGRVLIDWSQNASAKTTAAPYTLRVRTRPGVTAPVTWDEVAGCRHPSDLDFTPAQVLDRIAAHGDLLAPLGDRSARGLVP